MLNVETKKEDGKVIYAIEGRVDTVTAPQLQEEIMGDVDDSQIILDLEKLDYISSAGLRVILLAEKTVKAAGGSMVLKNVNDLVMEVFEMTGFVDILTIE